MSLRDQLLKAGVVSKAQAEASEAAERKAKQARKKAREQSRNQTDKHNKSEQKSPQSAPQPKKQTASARSNHKRDTNQHTSLSKSKALLAELGHKPAKSGTKARQAQLLALKHMIQRYRQNDPAASEDYNFLSAKKVRKVRVTSAQSESLANGELALIRNPQDSFDYVLVPAEVARAIAQIESNAILVLNDPTDAAGSTDESDPLATDRPSSE